MRAFKMGALIVAFVVLFPYLADGQERSSRKDMTRFAGTWELDDAYVSRGGRQTWVINVAETQMRIVKILRRESGTVDTHEVVLWGDKRGEENNIPIDRDKSAVIKSQTAWEREQLVGRYKRVPDNDTLRTARIAEQFKLSNDGRHLTVTYLRCDDTNVFVPTNADQERSICFDHKKVFVRQP